MRKIKFSFVLPLLSLLFILSDNYCVLAYYDEVYANIIIHTDGTVYKIPDGYVIYYVSGSPDAEREFPYKYLPLWRYNDTESLRDIMMYNSPNSKSNEFALANFYGDILHDNLTMVQVEEYFTGFTSKRAKLNDGLQSIPDYSESVPKFKLVDKNGLSIVPSGKYQIGLLSPETGATSHIVTDETGLIRVNTGNYFDFNDMSDVKYGYIDRYGNDIITLKYDYAEGFHDGLAAVGIGSFQDGFEFKYIDSNENTVFTVPEDYWPENYSEGYALIRTSVFHITNNYFDQSRYRYYDINGNDTGLGEFSYATDFKNGLAVVKDSIDSEYKIIDKTGNVLISAHFDRIENYKASGIILARIDDQDELSEFAKKYMLDSVQTKQTDPAQ